MWTATMVLYASGAIPIYPLHTPVLLMVGMGAFYFR
jgi:hypothetical protein